MNRSQPVKEKRGMSSHSGKIGLCEERQEASWCLFKFKIHGVEWERREAGEVLIGGDLIIRDLEGLVKRDF